MAAEVSTLAIRRSVSKLLRTASTRMSDDEDEVLQTVLLKVLELQQAGADDRAQDRGRYLLAMARNAAWDLIRSRRRSLFVSDVLDRPSDDGAAYLMEEATLSVLQAYIAALPFDLAAVFSARFVTGLSQARVCRELAISRQHLRTLEQRLKSGAARLLEATDCVERLVAQKRHNSPGRINQNHEPPRL